MQGSMQRNSCSRFFFIHIFQTYFLNTPACTQLNPPRQKSSFKLKMSDNLELPAEGWLIRKQFDKRKSSLFQTIINLMSQGIYDLDALINQKLHFHGTLLFTLTPGFTVFSLSVVVTDTMLAWDNDFPTGPRSHSLGQFQEKAGKYLGTVLCQHSPTGIRVVM